MFLGDVPPLWFIELDEFVLPDDAAWLTEWVTHAQTFALPHIEPLGWTNGFSGTGDLVTPMRMEIGRPPADSYETPRLWLIKLPGWERHRLWVVGWSDEQEADVGFWYDVARAAMEAVGTSDQSFDWHAIIGPALGTYNTHRMVYLRTPGTIGTVLLRSEEKGYSEYDATRSAMLGLGGSVVVWWPLVASGSARAPDWHTAQRNTVTAALHRVCALITVAWDVCFTVRAHTQPGEFHALPEGPAGEVHPDMLLRRRDVEIPTWADEAWRRLDESELLRDALGMYHQGCLLESEHPSFALTAFVSTVETIAQLRKGVKHCSQCGQVVGSGKRFQDAVAEVLSADRAELVSDVYKPRSRTVHRATLHGDEKKVGHITFGPLFDRPEDNFRWVTLRYTKEAARAWLLRALGDVEPSR